MQGTSLRPAPSLLQNFTNKELLALVKKARLRATPPHSRTPLVDFISQHLSNDEIVDAVGRLFPKSKARPGVLRLDKLPRIHGSATVQASSPTRPTVGQLLLEHGDGCLVLEVNSAPLFLENRWAVVGLSLGRFPRERLYATFVQPGKVHQNAEMPPPRNKPFLLDEGEYGLRNRRLRLELEHAGPISFQLTFLRYRGRAGQPEYLLEPIA